MLDFREPLAQLESRSLRRRRLTVTTQSAAACEIDGRRVTNFSSNDYLGLCHHPDVKLAAQEAVARHGAGSGASHLVTGHHPLHDELEQALAEWVGRERALYFSSGYAANTGLLSAISGKCDLLLLDKLAHASLIDGAQLSSAVMRRFQHNDLDSLVTLLERHRAESNHCLIVTESVFSMDGDSPDLHAMTEVAARYDAQIVLDEAHGIGTTNSGRGLAFDHQIAADTVPFVVGTLGKALGVSGAFVAGSDDAIEFLVQRCRPYIYTTATPPALAAATLASLNVLRTDDGRRERLRRNIDYFKSAAAHCELSMSASDTPIQPLIIGSADQALALEKWLLEQGMLAKAIRPPTVPEGASRLRVTITADHSEQQISMLLNAIAQWMAASANA